MTPYDERWLCAGTACWLAACGGTLSALGLGAAALAAALLVLAPAAGAAVQLAAAAVLLATPLERLLALRLQLDAGLFGQLAAADGGDRRLTALDAALATLDLRAATPEPRALGPRVAGARRLSRQYLAVVLGQALAAALALLLATLGRLP